MTAHANHESIGAPRPKRSRRASLLRDVGLALFFKVLLLLAVWWFCFGPDTRTRVTPTLVEQHLFSPGGSR